MFWVEARCEPTGPHTKALGTKRTLTSLHAWSWGIFLMSTLVKDAIATAGTHP